MTATAMVRTTWATRRSSWSRCSVGSRTGEDQSLQLDNVDSVGLTDDVGGRCDGSADGPVDDDVEDGLVIERQVMDDVPKAVGRG